MAMSQLQEIAKKSFHNQDLVLWHSRSEQRSLPIPAVVVRQEEDNVLIRARVEGNVKEIMVSVDELAER